MIITIDGLSGTGKSWLAWQLAQHFGYHYLGSGYIYRLYAYDPDTISKLLHRSRSPHDICTFSFDGDVLAHYDGHDVTAALTSPEIAQRASQLAAKPEVRALLKSWQLSYDRAPGLVADGRDMGTVIFPHAQKKIYLTASCHVRAERRLMQLKNNGIHASLEEIIDQIKQRDDRDTNRSISPLKPAEQALHVDVSQLNRQEMLDTCLSLVQ